MKNQVINFLKEHHCVTRYSGKTKTMYITRSIVFNLKQLKAMKAVGISAIHKLVIAKFGYNLPFTLT